jgi:hypothetical protein
LNLQKIGKFTPKFTPKIISNKLLSQKAAKFFKIHFAHPTFQGDVLGEHYPPRCGGLLRDASKGAEEKPAISL